MLEFIEINSIHCSIESYRKETILKILQKSCILRNISYLGSEEISEYSKEHNKSYMFKHKLESIIRQIPKSFYINSIYHYSLQKHVQRPRPYFLWMSNILIDYHIFSCFCMYCKSKNLIFIPFVVFSMRSNFNHIMSYK